MIREIKDGLVPEWYPQDAVILAWPSATMDWEYILPKVTECYTEIIDRLLGYTNVVLLINEIVELPEDALRRWRTHPLHKLIVKDNFPLNDTWMRDVMPLFGYKSGKMVAYDYGFNAWGLKFASNWDNTAVRRLFFEQQLFAVDVLHHNRLDTILEGGAVEVNGRGELLTTSSVLWEANRNPNFLIGRHESYFEPGMGVNLVHDLQQTEPMDGDDTDGHIDTIARFVNDDTILYNSTDDPTERHYEMLKRLESELQSLRTGDGRPYRLIPLPIPSPMYDEEGCRLPATYANFLITNGAVLVPIYNDSQDEVALSIIRDAMPGYEVIGIDCTALVQQHGSLHCITMQVPRGFIHYRELER